MIPRPPASVAAPRQSAAFFSEAPGQRRSAETPLRQQVFENEHYDEGIFCGQATGL